eukprot:12272722-Karenia_brevis.AAC.1
MRDRLEGLVKLDMQVTDPNTNAAILSNSAAMLIQKEYEVLRQAHQHGAATEFQIQKIWEVVQHLALKHKKIAAGAQQASDNIQRIIQDLGEEIGETAEWQGAGTTAQHSLLQLA